MTGLLNFHCRFANQVEWKSKRTSDNLLSPLVIQKRGRLMIMITDGYGDCIDGGCAAV